MSGSQTFHQEYNRDGFYYIFDEKLIFLFPIIDVIEFHMVVRAGLGKSQV